MKPGSFIAGCGVLLVALGGPLGAAPDDTLGMALMSASVESDGTVAASSGMTSSGSVRVSEGEYEINFDRDLAACTCTASFGTHSGSFSNIYVQNWISAHCPWNPNSVRVVTVSNGVVNDSAFQLIVFCPK